MINYIGAAYYTFHLYIKALAGGSVPNPMAYTLFIYLFIYISLHSTAHLFWDFVQMLACCLTANLEVVLPHRCNHWERKQSGKTSVLPDVGRYKGNH